MEAANSHDSECKHGMERAWCSLCREVDGFKAGSDRQRNDCTIQTVVNLTGAEYSEAQELLEAQGKRKGAGSTKEQTIAALAECGWVATRSSLTIEQAQRSGRSFFVSARRNRVGHAWAIVAGEQLNQWNRNFRYTLFEVA